MLMDVLKLICSTTNLWAVLVIVCVLLWQWWKKPHPRFPPGPRGIPILGALPFVDVYMERTVKKWSLDKYGPVMSVRMGQKEVVFLNTYEAINQVKSLMVYELQQNIQRVLKRIYYIYLCLRKLS